jgi:hypothetical protein
MARTALSCAVNAIYERLPSVAMSTPECTLRPLDGIDRAPKRGGCDGVAVGQESASLLSARYFPPLLTGRNARRSKGKLIAARLRDIGVAVCRKGI